MNELENLKRKIREVIDNRDFDITPIKGILYDYMHNERDRNLLKISLESGIVEEIINKNNLDDIDIKRFENRLTDDYGLKEEYAHKSISLWLYILKDIEIKEREEEKVKEEEKINKEEKKEKYEEKISYKQNIGQLIWRYKTGSEIYSSPIVYNGKVYVGSDDYYLYCINADNGKLIWRYKTEFWIYSSPTVYNGKVYIGSCDHYLYCINADNGLPIWRYKTESDIYSSPAVYNGKVYVSSNDGYLYCIYAGD